MSAQSSKKKRLGSRRRVANQNETSKADELHVTDSTSVGQSHIPEESAESSNVFANLDNLQSETQHSPELSGNRRKLGSRRRNKGQHVKDSVTESDHEPREEVGDETRRTETTVTKQMSLATQPERQEVLSQGSDHDIMTATHGSYLYSATTPDYSSEVDLESLKPKSESLLAVLDENETHSEVASDSRLVETMQEGIDEYDILHSEEVKKNAHLVDNTNFREMPEDKPRSVSSVTEKEGKQGDINTELLRQDGKLQGNYLVSEDIEFFITPEMTTDKHISREHTEPECSVEQAIRASPKEELFTNEGQNEILNVSGVKDAHYSDDAVNKLHEQEVKPTENQEMTQMDYSFESVIHDATVNSEILSGNMEEQTEISDTYQSEFTDESPTNQDISHPDNKQDEHPTKENDFEALEKKNEDHVYDTKETQIRDIETVDTADQPVHQEKEDDFSEMEERESSLQTLQSEINAPLDSQPHQDDTDLNPIRSRRKLGSSRRNKGRQHVKDSAAASDHEHKEEDVESTTGNEAFDTAQVLLPIERTSPEVLSQGSEHDIMPVTHGSSFYSAIMPDYSSEVQSLTATNYPEADLESLIPKSDNLQEDHDERETDFKVEVSDESVEATLEERDKSDTLQSQEVRADHHSEDAVNKVHEQDGEPTQSQEMTQIDYSSESVIHDATENSEVLSGNLTEQTEISDTYQPELTDESPTNQDISNPDNKQDEHPTKENDFEALEKKNEDHVWFKEPQINDIETVDTADQPVHQEKEDDFSEMEERESSLQTLQSEINAPVDSQPHQDDTDFNPIRSRRKLGSSRRNKGRQHVKDSAAESYQEPTEDVDGNTRDNEPLETTEMSLTTETAAQEKSMETMLEAMDKLDTARTEDVSDRVKENAYIGIDLHSSSTADQQTIDQTNFREMPDDELPNVCSVAEKENEERDEDAELFRQDGNVRGNYLVSEDIEFFITPEMTTDKHISREHTEPECSVEQAILASPKEELFTNEGQNEILNVSEVKDAHYSDDAVNKLHEQEVKPTENQEMTQMDYSFESVIHDATVNSEILSGNMEEQTEISDTYQSEFTDESPTNQDISYPDNKQDEHPTKENDFEALEKKNEDHVYDTKETQIRDIETVDTADQPGHQEKEDNFSEMEERESSLQTLQSEINAPLDSQPHQDDTDLNPIRSRRKLGSSRRNKGRQHVKDSAAASDHEHKEEDVESTTGNEAFDTAQVLLPIERTSPEVLSQGSEHDIMPATHGSSFYSAIMPDYSSEVQSLTATNYPEADLESLIPKSDNLQEDHDERETDFKVEVSDESVEATLEGRDKSDTLQSQEVRADRHSEDAVNKVHEQDGEPTQSQEMTQIDYSSESVIHDATENSEVLSGNLTEQTEISDTYQPELTDESPTNQDISNPDNKQDEHPTKENDFEALEKKNEDHVWFKEPQINDIETVDTADQPVHQEKEDDFSEMEERESSLQTLQSEINAPVDSQPHQDDTDLNPIRSRRKLGSSRRNKGRQHVKDSAAESYQEPTEDVDGNTRDNEPLETTEMSLTTETAAQEKSMETMLEAMDKLDTAQTEDVSDQVKENAYIGIDLHSSSTADQQTIDQTNFREMPDDELPNVCSVAEKENEERDEDAELFRQDGNVRGNYLVSEDIEFFITPEMTTDKHISREHTEPECSVEQAILASPKEELFTNEGQNEILNVSEVKDAHYSDDAVNKLHEQEVKPTENQEITQMDYSFESVIHDATVNSEILSGNMEEQTEISDTYQPELTDESPTNQDISHPDNKQDEHPTKENDFEALEKKNEDHVYDTKETQIRDIETVDTADQPVHQEKEDDFSIMEERESSLQTLQSEINAPVDSQPHQDDTDFNPIRSRRKLGSSRRNKGRQHVKDSAAASDHEPTEDVDGNTRDNEPLETTEMSLTTETAVQEKSMETMLEAMDKLDTAQTEDVSDRVKENAYIGIDLHSSSTADQQTIDQTNFREMLDDELPNVCSVAEKENEERDEDAELFRQDGNVWGNYLVSEDIEFFITPEMTTDKHISREHTEPECSVEQAILASPKEELFTNEGQNEILNVSEVKDAHYSDDAVNKLHEQEVKPTENQEITQMDYSFESVIHDATVNSEILSGNMEEQTEISDTYQSEFTDESPTNQDISYPDNKQDEHPTKINDFEALEKKNEDHVYDTKETQIRDIETVDTADQPGHQEKEDDFSIMEERESSLQTLQSEINAPLDSQPHQDDTDFNPIRSRRKLGSSRRNKGRQHVKDSAAASDHEHKEEDVESTTGNEAFDTAQVLLPIERTSPDVLSQGSEHDIMPVTHGSSFYSAIMPDYSSEVQSLTATNYPEADLESLIPKSDNLQEDHDERETDFKVEVSDESVEATLEERDKSDTLQSQEVRADRHSEDAVNKVHEQDGEPTQSQEMTQIDYSSESVIHDAIGNSKVLSGNLTEKTEISDTYQPEFTDESPTNQDISNPDNKQDGHPTKENDFEALEKKNEDHVYDTKETQIRDIERVDTALDQVYETEGRLENDIKPSVDQPGHQEKEEHFSEMEERESSLQTLQSEINAPLDSQPHQDNTDFNPIRSRRKLGSSRRNKGRQHVKDSAAASDHEHKEEDVESTTGNEAFEKANVLLPIETLRLYTYQPVLTDESPTNQDISNPDHKQDEHPTKENHFEALEKKNDDHVYHTKRTHFNDKERVDTALDQVYETEGRVEDDIKPSAEQTGLQEEDGLSESSSHTLQSEINAPLDSQPHQDNTDLNPIKSRRKLGSSRRNKGRQHVKDSAAASDHEPTEDVDGNTRDNEALETTETAVQEKSMETMLEAMDKLDTAQTEDISDQVKENTYIGIDLHSSSTADQQTINQTNFRKMPDDELPNVCSVAEKENEERDEDAELFRQDGNLKINSEKSSPGKHTDIECSVEQAAFSSSKEKCSTNEEQQEHENLSQVIGAWHLEHAVNEEEVKPAQKQEMHQTDNLSVKDGESHLQTLQSEMDAPLDSQPLDSSETHTGFNPTGTRRKLGSSRRNKGRLDVKDTTKMPFVTETMGQEELKEQTDLDFKSAGKIRKIRSTVNDEELTEKMSEEDAILSQNVMDDFTVVTTDITSSPGKDDIVVSNPKEVNKEENKLGEKDTDNLNQLTEYDRNNSKIQSISYHDDIADDNMQQTNDTLVTVGDVVIKDCNTGAESSMYVQVSGQDKGGEQFEDPTKKGHEAQEMNVSQEITHVELFSAAHNKKLQEKSKQKRRKMGSTRRSQLNRKPEEGRGETQENDFTEANMNDVDKMEVAEELTKTVTAEVHQENNEFTSDLQSGQSSMMSDTDYTKALFPEQSASHKEEDVNPIKFVHVADVRDNESNVDVSVEPSHIDEFTATEMHITSVFTRDTPNTDITSVNAIQDQDLKSAEEAFVADLEILKSVVRGGATEEHMSPQVSNQEPDTANEGAHNRNLEMKSASPNLDSPSRRRKMGSTRRNLRSQTKQEDVHQKQEVDNEAADTATNVGDVKAEGFSNIIEDELELNIEQKDSGSEQRKEKVFETVEFRHIDESHFKPLARQTFEENPVSHGELEEKEHQLTYLSTMPSTSPKHDLMSESASGGRRRKMGSHRKSHGHQKHENQTASDSLNGRDFKSTTDESAIKTTEELRGASLGLDKIPEVDASDKKQLSSISTSKEGEHSRPASEKTPEPATPVKHPYAEIHLGQKSQQKFSLAGSSDLGSNNFNVMMVGDSSVGKTSFIKRAQSGKFSLDLPASVGLDSFKWTVVVDGKPVVLQLWDTAGQERFHSITRQIFHKAHAFLLMYDITSSQSFSAVSYWASCIQEGAAESATILLVGNKSDCAERQVKTQEAETLATEYNFAFMECSAATGENVVQSLETVARMLSQKVDTREESVVLHKEPQQKKSSGCC